MTQASKRLRRTRRISQLPPTKTALRIAELRAMPYKDYLKTPEWQRRRQVVLKFADGRCQICNSPYQFQVHHRTYERLGCERLSDLILLCNDCHSLYHQNGRLHR